jgi:CubicO group peptidase (beta-lactamase class C family)
MIADKTGRLLTARLASEQAEQRLPSIAAGVARSGELAWTAGRGRVEGSEPDADTQYRAGSITKTFVAVEVMRLRDAGRLSLSDRLADHLAEPAVSDQVAAMTIGQLLSQSAGLRAETAGPWWERTPGGPLGELAATSLGPGAARFRPGRQFHYSNVGYALLGAVLASKHGRPWADVIATELLAPLEMTRTTTRPQAPHATGYAVHPYADVLLAEPEHDAGAMAPAGQLWTTVTDLAKFARFLAGDSAGLIAPATLAEMREPIVVSAMPGQPWTAAYGLGLQLWNSGGVLRYGHTGSMPGFVAVLSITDGPGRDTVIAACNSTTGFHQALASDLLAILAAEEPYVAKEWKPAPVAAGLLDVLGAWFWGPAPHTLRLTGELLVLSRDGRDDRGMRFRRDDGSEGRWRGIDGYMAGEPLRMITGPDGRVIALDIGSFIYSRQPYDPAAPIPDGVGPDSWQVPVK